MTSLNLDEVNSLYKESTTQYLYFILITFCSDVIKTIYKIGVTNQPYRIRINEIKNTYKSDGKKVKDIEIIFLGNIRKQEHYEKLYKDTYDNKLSDIQSNSNTKATECYEYCDNTLFNFKEFLYNYIKNLEEHYISDKISNISIDCPSLPEDIIEKILALKITLKTGYKLIIRSIYDRSNWVISVIKSVNEINNEVTVEVTVEDTVKKSVYIMHISLDPETYGIEWVIPSNYFPPTRKMIESLSWEDNKLFVRVNDEFIEAEFIIKKGNYNVEYIDKNNKKTTLPILKFDYGETWKIINKYTNLMVVFK